MANKLPWFTHDHDAHQDIALRMAVRRHGHLAGWVYWVTLELLHKHGIGDKLSMPLVDMAASMMVDTRTCKKVYTTLCELRLITSATYEQDACTVCTVTVEKFRERQSKLKFKIPSTLHEGSPKTPQEREEQEEVEKEEKKKNSPPVAEVSLDSFAETETTPAHGATTGEQKTTALAARGVPSSFDAFWSLWRKKSGKAEAQKAWKKLSPDGALQKKILDAVVRQWDNHDALAASGKFVPDMKMPQGWLNGRRWEDDISASGRDVQGDKMRAETVAHLEMLKSQGAS